MVALRDERLQEFGRAIDQIRSDIEARIGAEDVHYIKKVRRFSRAMEVSGRLLILDAKAMHWRELRLPKDPQCPVCSAAKHQ